MALYILKTLIVPLDRAGGSDPEAVQLDRRGWLKGDPVRHEEVEVFEGASDPGVGGDEGLVPRAELGRLCLVPYAHAAFEGVDVLGERLGVKELN